MAFSWQAVRKTAAACCISHRTILLYSRFCAAKKSPQRGFPGYTAVAADGIVTGFGKASNGVLKNRYPKGLRTHL